VGSGGGVTRLDGVSSSADDLDLDVIRRELEAHRDRSRERVVALAQRPELGSAQGFGKRIGDGTTEAVSRLTEIGVGESLERGLDRSERAIAKLDDGTYGACDACGAPIATARLRAIPDSVLCLACARTQRRHPPPRRR
jgi:DnaK suppressor protein